MNATALGLPCSRCLLVERYGDAHVRAVPRVRFESQVSPKRSYALFDAAWTYAKKIELLQAIAPAKEETLAVVIDSNLQVCAPLLK